MNTEHAEFLCRKIEGDVAEASSAVIEAGVLKVYFRRRDGQQRVMVLSVLGIDPCRLDDQQDLAAEVRRVIISENAHT